MASQTFILRWSNAGWSLPLILTYSESYNASTNKSTVRLTGYRFGNITTKDGGTITDYTANAYGRIAFNGTEVAAISDPDVVGNRDYTVSSSAITIDHDSTGKATMTVTFSPYDPSWSNPMYVVVDNVQSGNRFVVEKTSYPVPLTTHNRAYTLTINAGTGSTITVRRGTQTLANGATIYYGDSLTVTAAAKTGYKLTSNPSGNRTVTGNVSVSASAEVLSYTLTATQGANTTLTVKRTSSPLKGAATGALKSGATIYYNDVLAITATANAGYKLTSDPTNSARTVTGNVSVTSAATALASSVDSMTSSVLTNGTFTMTVVRASSAIYHKATFKVGTTTLYTSAAFASSLSFTVPRTWFNNSPSTTTLTVTVSMQTYTSQSCTTTIGSPVTRSLTVTADSGMKPTVASGWVSAAPYNTGTAAANINGYVQGLSKAQITFNSAKISMANGATLASLEIKVGSVKDSTSPYLTPTLSAVNNSVVCTVTDSRGRTASQTLTVTCMEYSAPRLGGISVFRSNASGAKDNDGEYVSVKATGYYSTLNGQNALTLTAQKSSAGSSFANLGTLTSGTARVFSGFDPDTTYSIRIRATDTIGRSAVYTATLAGRAWAMKFRPDGNGVAFGKRAEIDKMLELPTGWEFGIGGIPLQPMRENQLDNWHFGNAVNQRGKTTYSGTGYSIDRWKLSGSVTKLVKDGTNAWVFSGNGGFLLQFIENPERFSGATVTLSLLAKSLVGRTYFGIFINGSSSALAGNLKYIAAGSSYACHTLTTTLPTGITKLEVHIGILGSDAAGTSASIKAAKLEFNSVQSLCHKEGGAWQMSDYPNFAEQMQRCQRFYQIFATQSLRPSKAQDFRPAMRTNPALSTITVGSTTMYTASADL